jgi:hypothetical protein
VLGRTKSYTDNEGNIWQASTGYNEGGIFDNGWIGPPTSSTYLYQVELFAPGDMLFDFTVPNGTYRVIGKFASTNAKAPGKFSFHIESQGKIIHPDTDLFVAAGGEYKPVDFEAPATVTDNQLSYVLRHVSGENLSIAAIQIEPLNTSVGSNPRPSPPPPPAGVMAVVKPQRP